MYVRVSGDEIFRERYDIIAIIIIIIWTQFNFSTLHVSECRQSSAFRSAWCRLPEMRKVIYSWIELT